MKKLWQDFKKFITRGNILDLAIGVIIGSAFNKIVTSLVNDVIMPLLGWAMGGKSLSGLVLVLNGEPLHLADGSLNPSALTWNYGNFIQTIIDFLIVALTLFIILKVATKSREFFKESAEKVKKERLTKEDKAELKNRGISRRNKEAVKAYLEEKEANALAVKQAEEEKKKLAEEEAKKNSTEYLLKEIRDLLAENKALKEQVAEQEEKKA